MVSHSSICSSTRPKEFLSKALRSALNASASPPEKEGERSPAPCPCLPKKQKD
jgi:hypothetical protein